VSVLEWAIYVGMNWLLAAVLAARYDISRLSRHGNGWICLGMIVCRANSGVGKAEAPQ
jgi:hypothetical protein